MQSLAAAAALHSDPLGPLMYVSVAALCSCVWLKSCINHHTLIYLNVNFSLKNTLRIASAFGNSQILNLFRCCCYFCVLPKSMLHFFSHASLASVDFSLTIFAIWPECGLSLGVCECCIYVDVYVCVCWCIFFKC